MATSPLSTTHQHSLEEIHGSVAIPQSWWKRFLAFSGPAFLVSVGYMDPGNWGTDIEAGSRFGYQLLWVLLLSNLMALLLQSLATRLGVVTGLDLAQACRDRYPRWSVVAQWILCEIAIAACDLAEVIGTVIGLKLLFGFPYLVGLAIAAADTFLLLALQRKGVRLVELVTLALIAVIGGSLCIEIFMVRPEWPEVLRGFLPGLATGQYRESLYVAISMLGATVMPHNLYLHSALVQSRAFPQTFEGKRLACKYNLFDSLLALNGAFFVNAAILILSVCTFYMNHKEVETLQEAHSFLESVWGSSLAGVLFALALLASGQSSTLTGTLAGQVVMEGFVRLRIRPWVRRLFTRSLALAPALIVIGLVDNTSLWGSSVDNSLLNLLVLSQVILCFQLPFAIVPLVQCTSDRSRMGEFANRGWLKTLAWSCAGIVISLDAVFIFLQIGKWAESAGKLSPWVYATLYPLAATLASFLLWLTIHPLRHRRDEIQGEPAVPVLIPVVIYRRIGVGVELEGNDAAVLAQAVALSRLHGATVVAVHVVEGPAADYHGAEADDHESRRDRLRITEMAEHLRTEGIDAHSVLGYGTPADELVRIANEERLDLLVLGTHGHRFFADLALGQTVAPVIHRLTIPILVVPNPPKPQV